MCLPGRVVFRSVSIVNTHLFAVKVIEVRASAFSVCTLWPDKRARNMVGFQDISLRLNSIPRVQVLSTFGTEFTSLISFYHGKEGLFSKTPLTNLVKSGWLPKWTLPGSTIIDDRALRAVFIQLYPTPVAKKSPSKFIPSCKVTWSFVDSRMIPTSCGKFGTGLWCLISMTAWWSFTLLSKFLGFQEISSQVAHQ